MASTLTNLLYHIIFSTKDRHALIQPQRAAELHAYIGGIIRGEKGTLLQIGGTANHVHLLTRFPPAISLSEMMQRIKGNSSRWVNEQQPPAHEFAWQRGYGAFSVSESLVRSVEEYIRTQAEHHRKMTFQEEFLTLLKKHNVEYDERYIWT